MSEKFKFPVTAHYRIIVHSAEKDLETTQRLFDGFDLVEPVREMRASSGGRYASFSVSVRFGGRDEMSRFDAQLKFVPGLKMVL